MKQASSGLAAALLTGNLFFKVGMQLLPDMAPKKTFHQLLDEYLPGEMMQAEILKRDYLLNQISNDYEWKSQGEIFVLPFKGDS